MERFTREKKRLVRCLRVEERRYIQGGSFDISNDQMFWIPVFIRYFGWPPGSLEDERWDTLFHQLKGLRLQHQLLGRPRYW